MNYKKTLISSILTIVFSSIWILANGFITFVLWLVLGIGSAFDENFSAPIQSLVVVLLILLGIISILNIVFASITIRKRNTGIKCLFKVLVSLLLVSFIINMTLSLLIGNILLMLMYVAFSVINITCAILLIIDKKTNIKNDKTV